jgi:hypothetical protein
MEDSILLWIQQWYQSQCNGDWEHEYGVKIHTLDNPGWHVTIDLIDTNLQSLEITGELVEITDDDWYYYSIKEGVYKAAGDPTKLELLLRKFKQIAET